VLSRANEQKPNAILIEDAGFGTALIGALKQRALPVVAVKPEGDKKTRLLRQITKFTNSQVFLWKNAPGRTDLEVELFIFPGGPHSRRPIIDRSPRIAVLIHRITVQPQSQREFCNTIRGVADMVGPAAGFVPVENDPSRK
jgi:phage terminase large subunit-like protein